LASLVDCDDDDGDADLNDTEYNDVVLFDSCAQLFCANLLDIVIELEVKSNYHDDSSSTHNDCYGSIVMVAILNFLFVNDGRVIVDRILLAISDGIMSYSFRTDVVYYNLSVVNNYDMLA
jgi:hypothetical protein